MHVRSATVEDLPALAGLVEAYWAFEEIGGFEREAVVDQLGRLLITPDAGEVWIAEAGQATAGYLILVYVFSLEHLGLTAEVDELYVVPHFRRQGVAAALLEVAESAARAASCRNISLQLGRSNDHARTLYQRCGYQERSGFELLEKHLDDRL